MVSSLDLLASKTQLHLLNMDSITYFDFSIVPYFQDIGTTTVGNNLGEILFKLVFSNTYA